MAVIARWTTPSITYKPSAVEVGNVDKIYMVIKQDDVEKIRKSIDDAIISEAGFTWYLEQTDTSKLAAKVVSAVKFDYTSGSARYTTLPKRYEITDSAINEVI